MNLLNCLAAIGLPLAMPALAGAAAAPEAGTLCSRSIRVQFPGTVAVTNRFGPQPLRFRLQALPALAAPGDTANLLLLSAEPGLLLQAPSASGSATSLVAGRLVFTAPAARQIQDFGAPALRATLGPTNRAPLNLRRHRALAIWLELDGPPSSEPLALEVQLEAGGRTVQFPPIQLGFSGARTVLLPEAADEPAPAGSAAGGFDYGAVSALSLRWAPGRAGPPPACRVRRIEAVAEFDGLLMMPELTIDETRLVITAALRTGDSVELGGDGRLRVFDAAGDLLTLMDPYGGVPRLKGGVNHVRLHSAEPAAARMTLITRAQEP